MLGNTTSLAGYIMEPHIPPPNMPSAAEDWVADFSHIFRGILILPPTQALFIWRCGFISSEFHLGFIASHFADTKSRSRWLSPRSLSDHVSQIQLASYHSPLSARRRTSVCLSALTHDTSSCTPYILSRPEYFALTFATGFNALLDCHFVWIFSIVSLTSPHITISSLMLVSLWRFRSKAILPRLVATPLPTSCMH
jgi:hypothetical protein